MQRERVGKDVVEKIPIEKKGWDSMYPQESPKSNKIDCFYNENTPCGAQKKVAFFGSF